MILLHWYKYNLFKLISTVPKDWREILAFPARDMRPAGDVPGIAGTAGAPWKRVRRVRIAFDARVVDRAENAVRQKALPCLQIPSAREASRMDEQMEKARARLIMAWPGYSPGLFARKGAFSSNGRRRQSRIARGAGSRQFYFQIQQ